MKRPGIQRSIHFSIPVVASLGLLLPLATGSARGAGEAPTTTGPDVTIIYLTGPGNYGQSGGIRGFSLGTTSCNIGSKPVNWCNDGGSSGCGADTTAADHPVIAQNLYRLRAGRFEQIGMSWLKHGFFALSGNLCFNDCQSTSGDWLGVHCSDPYSAGLNGTQANLGPRYQVNAATGLFVYPPADPSTQATIGRRLQVHNSDLDPNQNQGARYFVEGHYVTPDDHGAGNAKNNASYRQVRISGSGSQFDPSRRRAASRAIRSFFMWSISCAESSPRPSRTACTIRALVTRPR